MTKKETIRQPIVTVAGHVDHGKTSLLDTIAGTCVAEKEPGLITQKISFMLIPRELVEEKCKNLLKAFKIQLEVPGFLFIDTPGHAAFTNLRKRGGALADLGILVIDINEGIMDQTKESIEILKTSNVPFIVALNKIDRISGWNKLAESVKENLELQAEYTKKEFEKKLYKIITDFTNLGFNVDLFFRISDFKKQIALVPCSAKTSEGLPELIVMLAGLAQKFLKQELTTSKEAKGTILEIKREKGLTEVEAILYDGVLSKTDILVISTLQEPITIKPRTLYESRPLKKGYKLVQEVKAANGLKISLPSEVAESILPGMPFVAVKTKEEIEKTKKELRQDIKEILKLDKEGIIVKAESLGSLEALVFLLKKQGIKVRKAEIGNITKQDLALAKTNLEKEPLNACVLGFNVTAEEKEEKVKIITSNVIYHLIEELESWRKLRELEIEREKLQDLRWPFKLLVLKNCCFRKSKPAIFGVRVEQGILKPNTPLINQENEEVAEVKSIQSENKNIEKALQGQEVAISLPNVTFGRQVKENQVLYSNLTEEEFKKLKENKKLLTKQELMLLQEIAEIKRKSKTTWGI